MTLAGTLDSAEEASPQRTTGTAPCRGGSRAERRIVAGGKGAALLVSKARRTRRPLQAIRGRLAPKRLQGLVKLKFTVDRAGRVLVAQILQS